MRNNLGETARDLALRFNKLPVVEFIGEALETATQSRSDLLEMKG